MPQTNYTPILIYASGTTGNTPAAGNLTNSSGGSELAINYFDGRLFYKDASNVVQVLATKGTGIIGGSNTQVQFNSSGSLAGSANLTWSGTVLTSTGFSGPLNGTVGATTPAAGSFTTLNASTSAVVSVNTSSDALRITQTGSGNALLVEDEANPDSTPFAVNSSGQVGIGVGGASIPGGVGLYMISADGTANTDMVTYRAGNNSGAISFEFRKARGTFTSPVIVNSSDSLGNLTFRGYDGSGNIASAQINCAVDGTPGTNDMPGRLVFSTTLDGASSPTERMRIDNAGRVGIGGTPAASQSLAVSRSLTGDSQQYAVTSDGTVQSDVTGTARLYYSVGRTAATSFTLTNLRHFQAEQGTFGAGSTVSNQFGYFVTSNLIGATNNYGFWSDIPSGTNRWNFYANGTAQNYFAGNTLIGTLTNTNSSALVVNGTISETVSSVQYLVASQYDVGTDPNEIPINGYLGALAFMDSQFQQLAVGTGITAGVGTICKTSSGMEGGVSVTRVIIDLTGLNSGGTAGDIIGVNGTANPCYILALPSITVLGGRMTCLEAPAGGDTDIDLYSATEATGVEDQAITALTETQLINGGVQALGTTTYFAADPTFNGYLYLVGQGTANATYTAGRFLIEIFGVQP